MQAIVNADFDSKASSNNFPFDNVQITKVVIGQNQDIDGTLLTTHPFEGRISGLNIWNSKLNNWNMGQWYINGDKSQQPTVKWLTFGDPGKRFGNVHFVGITSAGRSKLKFQQPSYDKSPV